MQPRTLHGNDSGHKPLVLQGEPSNVDRVWLLSIRHSGTHYMYLPLQCMGYERCIVDWEVLKQRHPTGPCQFIHSHIDVGAEYQKYLLDEKVVIPLRNPIEVYKTHVYRYRRGIRSGQEVLPTILYAYDELERVADTRNAFVFQVDSPHQEDLWYQLRYFLEATQGKAYKQQPNNVSTSRTRPVTLEHGFTEEQVRLFHNPPDEVVKLARKFGY